MHHSKSGRDLFQPLSRATHSTSWAFWALFRGLCSLERHRTGEGEGFMCTHYTEPDPHISDHCAPARPHVS